MTIKPGLIKAGESIRITTPFKVISLITALGSISAPVLADTYYPSSEEEDKTKIQLLFKNLSQIALPIPPVDPVIKIFLPSILIF